eukprot:TRINITY_DN1829_c0_g1_i3.p1 TRINITY_DN1829_c0_g1~~TRINITY_DN1829_c0_g1_i3.p1  ORF type:complete len:1038 (-),score=259.17 TRINITY_DN1829_c0_g1_i3:84-3197(-)
MMHHTDSRTGLSLQQELLRFLVHIQALNPLYLAKLDQFIILPPRPNPGQKWEIEVLHHILSRLSVDQVEQLVALTSGHTLDDMQTSSSSSVPPPHSPQQRQEQSLANVTITSTSQLSSLMGLSSDQVESVGHLYQLLQLSEVLNVVSEAQLMGLYDAVADHAGQPVQQLQILQLLQQVFCEMQPETLLNLHQDASADYQSHSASPTGHSPPPSLLTSLPLRPDQYPVYAPLRKLLLLGANELVNLQHRLGQFGPVQMLQLLQLLQLSPFDVVTLQSLFAADHHHHSSSSGSSLGGSVSGLISTPPPVSFMPGLDLQISSGAVPTGSSYPSASNAISVSSSSISSGSGHFMNQDKLVLSIVDQPPEKAVYKRNVKPAPTIMVQGDQRHLDSSLFVYVTLIRCDTFQEEARFITGNKPVQVGANRIVSFKKLKIMVTSHQQGESLFCLRFELRRVSLNGEEFEVLHSMMSTPICLLSHSTQMKPVPIIIPLMQEVIPASGPVSGGTRVAVLGGSFADTPAIRVKFDNMEVVPEYKGEGTLVCHTPPHPAGTVNVRVGNAHNAWSESAGTFIYEDTLANGPQPGSQIVVGGGAPANHNMMNSSGAPGGSHGGLTASQQQLFQHIWSGDFSGMQTLHHQLSSVQPTNVTSPFNTYDVRGLAPLHYAAALGQRSILEYALAHGADPNIPSASRSSSSQGNTPLHWAVLHRHYDIVISLLRHGAHPIVQNMRGDTPLHWAVGLSNAADDGSNMRFVSALHEAAPAASNMCNSDGCTPLHIAAGCGAGLVLSYLVQHGGFTYAEDDEGDTPLHVAVREESEAAVKVLVEQVSSPPPLTHPNEDGESPLHIAAALGYNSILSILMSHNGANLEVRDSLGWTPVHHAAAAGHASTVALILERVASQSPSDSSPNSFVRYLRSRDLEGQTPLHLAALGGHEEAAWNLIFAGADPEARDLRGRTPLTISRKLREGMAQETNSRSSSFDMSSLGQVLKRITQQQQQLSHSSDSPRSSSTTTSGTACGSITSAVAWVGLRTSRPGETAAI